MTPDELRARCDQALEHLGKVAAVRYYSIDPTVELGENAYLELESLCREMIVVGLDRGADMAIKNANELILCGDDAVSCSMSDACRAVAWDCRQEAKRVKEGK